MTTIPWTQETWNPVVGCSLESPGCCGCWAMDDAAWLANIPTTREKYQGLTIKTKRGSVWTGKLRFWEPDLRKPFSWKRPKLVFPCSMSDIAHQDMPIGWFEQVWRVMVEAHEVRGHIFQALTKRPENLLRLLSAIGVTAPAPGIWLGVSAEDERRWQERISILREFLTDVHWVSAEPQTELIRPDLQGIDWVVQGGESRHRLKPPRPFDLEWARLMRDCCRDAGVAYFLKQIGSKAFEAGRPFPTKHRKGEDPTEWPEDLRVREWPK